MDSAPKWNTVSGVNFYLTTHPETLRGMRFICGHYNRDDATLSLAVERIHKAHNVHIADR
jgi:fructose-bisphosphate aldolase class 1